MEIGYLDTPEEWRDLFIMCFMVAGTLLFLVGTVFTIILGVLSAGVVMRTRRLLKMNVQPALENVRETTSTVRGTVTFVSDNAVRPVVKVYGVAAGARRFIAVVGRFTRPKEAG
ncbi:MAG: hypothetical protein Q7T33_09290 [Dehalococcoidia bacterium]|nr:hypothetical protein [Dehalococcoidia bacterium]